MSSEEKRIAAIKSINEILKRASSKIAMYENEIDALKSNKSPVPGLTMPSYGGSLFVSEATKTQKEAAIEGKIQEEKSKAVKDVNTIISDLDPVTQTNVHETYNKWLQAPTQYRPEKDDKLYEAEERMINLLSEQKEKNIFSDKKEIQPSLSTAVTGPYTAVSWSAQFTYFDGVAGGAGGDLEKDSSKDDKEPDPGGA